MKHLHFTDMKAPNEKIQVFQFLVSSFLFLVTIIIDSPLRIDRAELAEAEGYTRVGDTIIFLLSILETRKRRLHPRKDTTRVERADAIE